MMNKELEEVLEYLEQLAEMADNCWVSCDVHKWKNTIKNYLLKTQQQDVVIEHINESYKALCQHIEINEKYVELKKYRDIVELSKISYDIALSKEQKGLCEKYFTWLKKDRSE